MELTSKEECLLFFCLFLIGILGIFNLSLIKFLFGVTSKVLEIILALIGLIGSIKMILNLN